MAGANAAFRTVFGEGLTPDAIGAALADPVGATERLITAWHRERVMPSALPPLAVGELRPLLGHGFSPNWRYGLSWAESELDRLTITLTYAHRAVLIDPFSYLEDILRSDAMTASVLAGILHIVAFAEPLTEASTVLMVTEPEQVTRLGRTGPWPAMRPSGLVTDVRAKIVRRIEDALGVFDNQPSEARWSRGIEDNAIGRDATIHLIRQTNAMAGRAHLLFEETHDWDFGYGQRTTFERMMMYAQLRALARAGVRHRGEVGKVLLLLRRPIPDMATVTPTDLLALRSSDGFGQVRHQVGDALERYEIGVRAGRADVGDGLADELRASAEALDAEIAASSAMTAMRRGVAALSMTAAAQVALALTGIGAATPVELATPAAVGALEYVRALVAASYERDRNRSLEAHATTARAVAERMALL
ncbi:MAG: hypothetical protein ACHQHO_02615 [Solirubrobacterales bacterium]